MSWINKQQAKRWWDFATLGKFKWYLFWIFVLLAVSKVVGTLAITTGRYEVLYQLCKRKQIGHFSKQSFLFQGLYDKWYPVWNPIMYWNYVWVNSDLWQPVGMAFTAILCLILAIAYFREFVPTYNWEGLLCKDGWLSSP